MIENNRKKHVFLTDTNFSDDLGSDHVWIYYDSNSAIVHIVLGSDEADQIFWNVTVVHDSLQLLKIINICPICVVAQLRDNISNVTIIASSVFKG